MQLKKNILLCIYKMYLISTEGYKNVKAIKTTRETWVNMKDIGSGNKNKLPIDVTYKNCLLREVQKRYWKYWPKNGYNKK